MKEIPSILIAAEASESRRLVENYFLKVRVRVVTCGNGLEVVRALRSLKIGLLILGEDLPGVTAPELVKMFLRKGPRKLIPVYYLGKSELDPATQSLFERREVRVLSAPPTAAMLRKVLLDHFPDLLDDKKLASNSVKKLLENLGEASTRDLTETSGKFDRDFWEAFRGACDGQTYVVLIPKGLEVQSLKILNDEALRKHVKVWEELSGQEVWPGEYPPK